MNRRRFLAAMASLLPAGLAAKLLPAEAPVELFKIRHVYSGHLDLVPMKLEPWLVRVIGRGLESGGPYEWNQIGEMEWGKSETGKVIVEPGTFNELVLIERVEVIPFCHHPVKEIKTVYIDAAG